MPTSLHQALSNIDLFAPLDQDAIALIAESGATIRSAPGSRVITQGAQDNGLRVVLEGTATVTVGDDERGTVGPGEYVGEISLIDGEPRSATLTAGPDGVRTFALSSMAFGPLLEANPTIARALLHTLCARLRKVEAAAARH